MTLSILSTALVKARIASWGLSFLTPGKKKKSHGARGRGHDALDNELTTIRRATKVFGTKLRGHVGSLGVSVRK